MKLEVIADVLNGLYLNGVIRAKKKLDSRDFMQMAIAAHGAVIRKYYYDERQNGTVMSFVSSNCRTLEFKVKKDSRQRTIIDMDMDDVRIARLPNGDGILRITPIYEGKRIEYEESYIPGKAGSEVLYCTKKFLDDTGSKIYMFSADRIALYGSVDPVAVEVLAIFYNEDAEISEEIAWDILVAIFNTFILKVSDDRVNMNDDQNPVVRELKSKLTLPQSA